MRFQSIQWRLIASYLLLALVTVTVMGWLALSLMERYMAQQEEEYLQANAAALAHRATPLLQPLRPHALENLAHASAFLGNVRVRILDASQQPVVDSGPRTQVDEIVVIGSPAEEDILVEMAAPPPVIMMAFPAGAELPLENIGAFAAQASEHTAPLPPADLLAAWGELPPNAEVTIVRRVEGPWGSQFSFDGFEIAVPSQTLPLAQHQEALEFLVQTELPRSPRTLRYPIGEGQQPLGYVELSAGPDLGTDALNAMRRVFGLAAAAAALIAVSIGLLVSQGFTAPLQSLTSAASQMSAGDLSARATVQGRSEIGQLAHQFNQMADRLQASFAELAAERDTLRRFIADASHELRTPITALRTFNELLQNPTLTDPATRAEFLAESQSQLKRLTWITHNLLDLSRLDAGLVALDIAPHTVGELLERAAASFRALAQERQITLHIPPPLAPLILHADRARIEMVLANLLDNALKFTPPGGHVSLGADSPTPDTIQVWVRDSGPGIPPADQPHIFERFYRANTHQVPGSGLGLAIVASIAHAHHGHVTVASTPGEGSLFTIHLPRERQ